MKLRHRRRGVDRWYTDPVTGTTLVTFKNGLRRIYSREEIGAYVVQVAQQAVRDPGSVDEPWYEFLRSVVGEEMMQRTIAQVAALETNAEDPLPPGLNIRLSQDA